MPPHDSVAVNIDRLSIMQVPEKTTLKGRIRLWWYSLPTSFRRALRRYDRVPCETALAAIAFAAGMWFLFLTDVYNTSPIWHGLSRYVPEMLYGFVLATLGALQFWAIGVDKPNWRRWMCFTGAFVWGVTWLTFIQTDIANLGVALFGVFTLFNVWMALRIRYKYQNSQRVDES